MAIKGKSKKRSKGGAPRRPAAAPRPQSYSKARTAWHHTAGGRVALAIVVVLLISSVGGLVAALRGSAAEEGRRRDALNAFGQAVRTVQEEAAPAASGLAAAPADPEAPGFDALEGEAAGWAEDFETAVSNTVGIQAPPEALGVDDLVRQALSLYSASARTYEVAASLQGRAAGRVLERAAEQRNRAGSVWLSAMGILDAARADLGLDPLRIAPPGDLASGLQPPAELDGEVVVPEADEDAEPAPNSDGDGGDAGNE